jgi:tetratricopeptide (TPR) repeat protein
MHKIVFFIFLTVFFTGCKSSKEPVNVGHSSIFIKNFHEGIRLKINGQIDEAISMFDKCLLEDEKDDATHFALAQLFLMKEDVASAAIHTQKAVDADPDNFYYQSELAFMYQELGQHQNAAVAFEKLSKKQVQNQEFYLGAAENWARAGKVTKAVETLNTMEKYIGSSPEIAIQKFRLYSIAKDEKMALQTLLDAKIKYPEEANIVANLVDFYMQNKRYEEGMNMLKELTRVDPDNGLARMMLGEMQLQIGDEPNGLLNLKQSIKLDGPSLDQKMKILIALQKHFESDKDLENLVDYMTIQYPKEAKAHSIKGDYYFKNSQEDKALMSYKNAVKCDPNLYPIWNQILILEYQNQQWDSLSVDSEKCLAYFPIQPMPYFTSGLSLIQKKMYKDAIEKLQSGLDIVVNDATLEAEILGQLGEANFALNNLEKGKEFYSKALLKQPKSLFVKNNDAYRLILHNTDLEKAQKLIDEIFAEKNDDARFLDTKGYLLFRQGKYAEALTIFEQSNKLLPKDKIVLDHLGDCEFYLGKKDKAVEYWKEAKSLGSTNQVIDKKIQNKLYYDPIF